MGGTLEIPQTGQGTRMEVCKALPGATAHHVVPQDTGGRVVARKLAWVPGVAHALAENIQFPRKPVAQWD